LALIVGGYAAAPPGARLLQPLPSAIAPHAMPQVGMMLWRGDAGAPPRATGAGRSPRLSQQRREESMQRKPGHFGIGLFVASALVAAPSLAADIIVSAQDGKFVRVEGKATFPQPAPPDSLVVIDASVSPPVIKGTLEGLEHTVQGPPQAVAVTPDGKLAIVAAPTRYDYEAKKELFDNFLQIVDIEASPPCRRG
jgi:hypothetical protein